MGCVTSIGENANKVLEGIKGMWKQRFEKWESYERLNPELMNLLKEIRHDEKILEEHFYKYLEFGTGGMRGELGPGTNRLNVYTIRRAAEGLAQYIVESGDQAMQRGVVIAYDCRHKSPEFALESASVLGKHGIKVYLFDELRPTPELSFAVRHLNAFSGIVLTASHNPPQYNGFKVYGEDGGQITSNVAETIIHFIENVENELTVEKADEQDLRNSGLLVTIGEEIDKAYNEQLQTLVLDEELLSNHAKDLKIVFTPLHGTSNKSIRRGLASMGYANVKVVKEQELPDPNFSTVKSPNPEEHEAFEIAIQYGKQVDADVLLGTDPDADRLGVAVKNPHGEYIVLTGNQTGALMLDYLLMKKHEMGTLPDNGIVVKTIVTSEIGREIAKAFNIPTLDTLTGFKYIGEKINQFEQSGEQSFLFGYEESYGYLIKDFVRDKDAVQAALFICEVATYYKSLGKTLYQGLLDIYETYGFFQEDLVSMTLKGRDGAAQIQRIMENFRQAHPKVVAGKVVEAVEDYQISERLILATSETMMIHLPKSNVLKYTFADGSWFTLRPSGTEPKIKFYFSAVGMDLEDSKLKLAAMREDVMRQLELSEPSAK